MISPYTFLSTLFIALLFAVFIYIIWKIIIFQNILPTISNFPKHFPNTFFQHSFPNLSSHCVLLTLPPHCVYSQLYNYLNAEGRQLEKFGKLVWKKCPTHFVNSFFKKKENSNFFKTKNSDFFSYLSYTLCFINTPSTTGVSQLYNYLEAVGKTIKEIWNTYFHICVSNVFFQVRHN